MFDHVHCDMLHKAINLFLLAKTVPVKLCCGCLLHGQGTTVIVTNDHYRHLGQANWIYWSSLIAGLDCGLDYWTDL